MELKANFGKNNNNGGKSDAYACGKTEKQVNDEFNRVLAGQPRVIGAGIKPVFKPSEVDCHGFPLPKIVKETPFAQAQWLVKHVSSEGIFRD